MRPIHSHLILAVAVAIGGAGCSAADEDASTSTTQASAEPATDSNTTAEEAGAEESGAEEPATEEAASEETTSEEPASEGLPADLELTPEQTEGPYYPVEPPTDTDDNLRQVFDGPTAEGNRLELQGVVVDLEGQPLVNAVVEIWQTDNNGAYLHPDDPRQDLRDPNFQSFGTSVTDEDGNYNFETIVPGVYENRPAHVHLKVLFEGSELLTSQIYFNGDELLADDAIAGAVSDGELALLTANLLDAQDGFSAVHNLIVQP